MQATSIDHVLDLLDRIIDRARETNSRHGYFAALYRDVTARVREACETGVFEDEARMRRLDVVFANRYLEAAQIWQEGRSPTRSWASTFDAAKRWSPLVIQHLLLGMNAHINLDLGIAAAEVTSGGQIADLKRDFFQINRILGAMIEEVQTRITSVSPWTGVLDRLGGRADEVISNFCLVAARNEAWEFALTLSKVVPSDHPQIIQRKDRETARRVDKILQPGGFWIVPVLLAIRLGEENNASTVIDALSATSPSASP